MQKIIDKSGVLTEERKAFLKTTGVISIMSLFEVSFFTGCSDESEQYPNLDNNSNSNSNNTAPSTTNGITVTDSAVTIDLNKTTNLKTSGGWLLITSAQMLVVNAGNEFYSSTLICTHSGCHRNWSFNNNQFICSCHDSRFTAQGEAVKGPANSPLRAFSNSLSGDIVTINRS